MFTGLIEEIGKINSTRPLGNGLRITIEAYKIMDDVKVDDSISINGACQTVVSKTNNTFTVEAVEETLKKTTLTNFKFGKKINLERALKLSDRLGGHIVQGHVDSTGKVISIQPLSAGILLWIQFPSEFSKYIVKHGSICIDGVSLTVADLEQNKFMVSIIPHTWNVTTLVDLKPNTEVNLEFDIIGKYVENLVTSGAVINNNIEKKKSILEQYITQPEF
jgi:riboflavin synthase